MNKGGSAPSTEPEATGKLDGRRLRSCFGHFATGVTVVTYEAGGESRGATMNSFTSVSIDPPLVLVSVARTARACEAMAGKPFVVNVLAENQLDLAFHFAGKAKPGVQIPWVERAGVPRLRGGVAWLECRPWAKYDGGDHVLFLGEVVRYDSRRGQPLLFYRGDFRMLGLAVYELPRVVPLDGRPIAEWVGSIHRFHQISDVGAGREPPSPS